MAVIIDLADSIYPYIESARDLFSVDELNKDIDNIISLQVREVAEYVNQAEDGYDFCDDVRQAEESYREWIEEASSPEERFHADLYRELIINLARHAALDIVYLNRVTRIGYYVVIETKDARSTPEDS